MKKESRSDFHIFNDINRGPMIRANHWGPHGYSSTTFTYPAEAQDWIRRMDKRKPLEKV